MPENIKTQRNLIDTLARCGDLRGAYRAAARAAGVIAPGPDFELDRRDPRQDLQYGESIALCEDPGRYRGAVPALARIARRLPRLAGVELLAGVTETALGRYDRALPCLDRAVALDPGSSWAWAWRGVARSLQARLAKSEKALLPALKDLDRAVELGSARHFARRWRAELRHDLEDAAGAMSDLERILEETPGDLWACVELGEILCERGRFDEAMHQFDRLVKRLPGTAWAFALRGRTLATSGRAQESLRDLERAVRLAPRVASNRAWLSEAYRKLGRYQAALKQLDVAVRQQPGFVLAWIWRGRLRLGLGLYAEAVADLNRAIRLDPRYRLAYAWRGEANFKLGRLPQAAEDFSRPGISPMDPRNTWMPRLKEGVPVETEARGKAFWEDLSRAVQKRPKDRWVRRLWESSLQRIPVSAPSRSEETVTA